MVAIFSGNGLGFQRSTVSTLGARGLLGDATVGRGGDQIFVNAATGNLVVNRKDEFLIGRGPDALYSQTYNSSSGSSDPALAWAQGIHRVLHSITGTINAAGSTISRRDGDGHSSVYTFDSAKGAYVTTEGGGSHDEIRYASGAWTWTDGDSRMRETYTALSGVPGEHFVSTVVDVDNNTQTYAWNSNGTIQRITNANGDYSEFTLSSGLPTQIRTFYANTSGGTSSLTRVRYAWDSLRRLSSVTVDLSPDDNSATDLHTYVTTYTYDGTSGRIGAITQSDGSRLDIAYTQLGSDYRVTKLTQTVSSGVTRVTGIYYDVASRATTITDPLGGATTMRYNSAGNLIQITYPVPAPGATAPTTSYAYNASGDIASMTEGGRTTAYSYDSNGNMTLSRDSAGNTVARTYGSKNELLTSTQYLVPDPDGPGAAQAASPVTARYAYNSENHLRFQVSADGQVTEYRYNAQGTLASTLRYTANSYTTAGSITENMLATWATGIADKTTIARTDATYDFRGNVGSVTTYSKTLSDGSGDLGSTYTRTLYVYDPAGNLLSRQIVGQSGSESFLYDGLNRIVSSTDAAGALTSFAFNDAATTTTVTLGNGLTRLSVFDKAGQMISLTETGGDIPQAVTSYAYDALGRLRMTTDPTGRKTFHVYDSVGRKVADVTADGAITEYGYNSGNRLVKTVAYMNKLSTSQIALLSGFSAGGAGGANAGGIGGPTGSTLLTNGSFDQSGSFTATDTGRSNTTLPGWTRTNPETFEQVSSGQMGVFASDGAYWLDLESVITTGVVPVGLNLLVNGSFDQSGSYVATTTGRSNTNLPGWIKSNPETFEQVISGQMGVTGTDGGFWLDLESTESPGPQPIGENLVVNGSFETSGAFIDTATGRANTTLPGWTKANPQPFEQVDAETSVISGTSGIYWLDLDSVPSLTGTIPGPNLIVNGSFEESATSYTTNPTGRYNDPTLNIPGWVKANEQGFEQLNSGTDGVTATDGSFYLDMEANEGAESRMDISQTIAGLTASRLLTLKFDYANIAGLAFGGEEMENSGSLEVYWNGLLVAIVTAEQGPAMAVKTFTFASIEGDNTLRFREIGIADGTGVYLDNVRLYANVPAPNLIVNGSFEDSATSYEMTITGRYNDPALNIPGWVKANEQGFEQIISGTDGVAATDGSFYLDMEANGGPESRMDISQTITGLAESQQLTLSFDYANKAGLVFGGEEMENSGSLEVYWNGLLVGIVAAQDQTMAAKSFSVTSMEGDNILRFREVGMTDGKGVYLDNVRLHENTGGNMDISQTVSGLNAGEIMQLQFDHASLAAGEDNSFAVYWNEIHIATIDDGDVAMQTKSYFVTAVGGNNTIRFVGLGTIDGIGAALDNVRLFKTFTPPNGGNMDISQTVSLAAGKFVLQFDHANRTTSASGSFQVWWNNILVDTITSTGTAMQSKYYEVNAVAGNNTVRFKSIGPVDAAGASLDNVRLFATEPEPSGGNMDIRQTVSGLAAGQVLQLRFDHANRTTAASGSFEVWWNNTLVATVTETGTQMRTKYFLVTAQAGSNTLRFKSLGPVDNAGASLDNVRLFALQTGGPGGGAAPTDPLAGLRPTAHSLDDWTWRIYDTANRLIETIDAAGRATTFAYDGASRLVSSTAYANAIAAATVTGFKTTTPTAAVTPAGNAVTDRPTRSFYDSDGRLVGMLDAAGGLSQIFHDAAGQKIRDVAYSNPVAIGLRASGSFSELLASAGTSASDRRIDHVYDQRGLLRFTVDAAGHPTEFVYDSADRLIRTVDYAGAIGTAANYSLAYVQGQISTLNLASNPATRVTRSVYDGAGRLAYSIDAEGGTTALDYDVTGNPIKETRYVSAYTASGDQSLAAMNFWRIAHANEAGNRVTRQVFDAAGRMAYTVDPEGYVTKRVFDTAGRITRSIRYPSVYVVSDFVTKTSLDTQTGNPPPEAVVTDYGYDSAGRLTDLTDGAGNVTHYVYDALDQVVEETVGYNTSDAATLRRTYDAAGRILTETRGYGTADAATLTYGHDAVGNLLTVIDARNFTTSRDYDALGRVVRTVSPIGSSTNAITTGVYNRFGELVQATDAMGYSSYSYYDRLGRVVMTRNAADYLTQTAYNVFGDVTSVTRRYEKTESAVSTTVVPTFVAHGKDATTSFQYDRLGRLTRTTDAENKFEQYTLDAFGDRVTVVNKLGGITTNLFDKRGLLLSETLPMESVDSNGITVSMTVTNRFEYDSRGNRTMLREAFGLPEQRNTTYFYDKLDRLTETRGDQVTATTPSGATSLVIPTERIVYDRRGNIIETVDALGARTLYYFDRLNRNVAQISAAGTLSTHSYDKNGNVLTRRVYGTPIALPGTAGGTAPTAPGGEYRETSHTWDGLNRMLTSSVAGIRTGAWGTSSYSTSVGTVTTSFEYDANGNVTKTTDGNGGVSYTLYDTLNRASGKIDTEGYATVYGYDAEGNVTLERRYVNRAFGIGTPQPGVTPHADDRHTDFTYDRNGRRLTETRWSVAANSLGTNGNLVSATSDSVIVYTYNGLGQVTRKTEATGEFIEYGYDLSGRLTSEKRAAFQDNNGAQVRPTVRYYYDGLDNLKLARQGKEATSSGDRFTRYFYGAGGRLSKMTNAAGDAYEYSYDAAGNLALETYSRLKSDTNSVSEGISYSRDVLGRVTAQAVAQKVGSTWVRGDTHDMAYNAYGELSQRGVNNGAQEQFAYDGAGRLWRTNSSDGVWRYFVHDANGNQTLAIESEGTDLANKTIANVLAIATSNNAHGIGAAYIDGINATIIVYDKRGQAIQTRLPKRQLNETGSAVDLSVSRGYNSFGDVAWERDAKGNQTNYIYNTMGRNLSIEHPTVSITLESGTKQNMRPTDQFHYDLSGRLIGVTDANGNVTSRRLLAGTGYGGSEALVSAEYHSDGGVFRTYYDAFGDARILRNELNQDETRSYDAMGRLVSQTHRGGLLTDSYAYDVLGQRIKHWNSFLGASKIETTDYDLQGRIVRHVAFGGDLTTTSYVWSSSLATSGMATFGGWTQTTTFANGKAMTERSDLFGRALYKSDLGGHVSTFSYDLAGRMILRGGSETLDYAYLNTNLLGSVSKGWGTPGYPNDYELTKTVYGYDSNGNKTSERYFYESGYWEYQDPNPFDPPEEISLPPEQNPLPPEEGDLSDPDGEVEEIIVIEPLLQPVYQQYSATYQDATATYDALNRLKSWTEAGNLTAPASSIQYEYDAVGNVRRTFAQYRALDGTGAASATVSEQDHWYRYDAMNRVVTAKGMVWQGHIYRGYNGTEYAYDHAGQRVRTTRTVQAYASLVNPWYDPWDPNSQPYIDTWYDAEQREDHGFDGAGNLSTVRIAQSGYNDNGNGTLTVTPPPLIGDLKASYFYDDMGRLTRQADWLGNGTNAAYDRNVYYNDKSQIYYETVATKQGNDIYTNNNTHNFGAAGDYALGSIVFTTTVNLKNGGNQTNSRTDNTYYWFDGAVQATIKHKPNTSQSTLYTTTYYYSPSGTLNSISVADGRARSISFTNDMNGLAIRRDEGDNSANGDPHEVWYRFDGKQMGYTGNNGTLDTDYQTSIFNRTRTTGTGAFRFGATSGSSYADFDLSVDTITSYSQGGAGGSYVARGGDTLASIAASLWGDATLWYKLAEANGMTGAGALAEGQRLTIPAGVIKSHHNASTFRPYEPGEVIGDASPTTPKPGKKNKCGTFGQILLIVIAVAVSVLTYGALTGPATGVLASIGAGAVSGAAGSVASQAFGVATGIQDEFSWKNVALSALGGAVGAGVGPAFGTGGNAFVKGALRGAVSSAVTQGVAVATGLQDKFDWAGVAAAAIGGGVGEWSSVKLAGTNRYVGQAMSSSASAIANAATRSLIDGSDFGDNILSALPDVIGGTIGNLVSNTLMKSVRNAQVAVVLDLTGLEAAEGDNQISKEWIYQFLENGGTLAEAVQFFSDPSINQAARQFDASQRGGISTDDANHRLAETLERYERSKAYASAAQAGDGQVAPGDAYFSEEVMVYAVGPDGADIGKNVIGGGVNLIDGLTSFYDEHPRIASIGFTATQSVLTGGPLKTIATRLAGNIFGEAVDTASNYTANKATPYLTDLASDLGWKLDLKIASVEIPFGPQQIGSGGGQLAASVVSTVLGGGIVMVIKRGRAVRTLINPSVGEVGPYNLLKGSVEGLDAHHVGQKALMKKLIPEYDANTAPAILVPKEGHTIRGLRGIVSRSLKGLKTPRQVLARDIRELQRVYPDIPHSKLLQLIRMNTSMYPKAFKP